MSLKNIVWLASYPKSGNTWARLFLANYMLNRGETALPINDINKIGYGDSKAFLYRRVGGEGVRTDDHTAVLRLRPQVLRAIAGNGADMNFLKTHNARITVAGAPLIPPALTRSAVYLIRNPLDVVPSYARHFGVTTADAIRHVCSDQTRTAANDRDVKQFFSSWSGHAESWIDQVAFPVLVLRYEDLLDDPHSAFRALLGHLGIPVESAQLERAIRFTRFEELSRQEAETTFAESSRHSDRFFHTGRAGQWRTVLSEDQVAEIRAALGPTMRRFGYM